jgi:hypothetical protein
MYVEDNCDWVSKCFSSLKNPNLILYKIEQAEWFSSKSFYENEEDFQLYKDSIVEIADLFNTENPNVVSDVDKMAEFEKKLAMVNSIVRHHKLFNVIFF